MRTQEQAEIRCDFEAFKSNTCHFVKDMGDFDFIVSLLETDEIRVLYEKHWYPEALYLLAMLDYLSRVHDLPLCGKYNDIRAQKLTRPVYPTGVIITCWTLNSQEPLERAEREAIPEFRRFNIIESEVRNIA